MSNFYTFGIGQPNAKSIGQSQNAPALAPPPIGALPSNANIRGTGGGAYLRGSYTRTLAAIARVRAGAGFMKYALVGDSTTAGYLSRSSTAGATGLADARSASPTPYMAAALNRLDLPACDQSWFGDQNVAFQSSNLAAYDVRNILGAGWASSTTQSIGCKMLENSTTTNAITFQARGLVDRVEVYYATDAGLAQLQLTFAASLGLQNPNSAGAAGIGKATIVGNLTATDYRFYIGRVSGGAAKIIGLDAYNSTVPSVRLFNLGWLGAKVSDYLSNTSAYDALPALLALQCDCYDIQLGINDWRAGGVSVATYKANLISLVTALLAVGDVVLTTPYPSANTDTPLQTQVQYIAAIYEVATQFGLIVNDVWAKVSSQEQANSFGQYSDSLHPNMTLYKIGGEMRAAALLMMN